MTNHLKSRAPKLFLHVNHSLSICPVPQVAHKVVSGHFVKLWHQTIQVTDTRYREDRIYDSDSDDYDYIVRRLKKHYTFW